MAEKSSENVSPSELKAFFVTASQSRMMCEAEIGFFRNHLSREWKEEESTLHNILEFRFFEVFRKSFLSLSHQNEISIPKSVVFKELVVQQGIRQQVNLSMVRYSHILPVMSIALDRGCHLAHYLIKLGKQAGLGGIYRGMPGYSGLT